MNDDLPPRQDGAARDADASATGASDPLRPTQRALQIIDAMLALGADARARLDCALSAADALQRSLAITDEAAIDAPLKPVSERPVPPHSGPVDPHRAAHRMGRPSRLDSDPELNAFVQARINSMTFHQIAAAIAAQFPPERRASASAIHRWWQRTKRQ